ncbi:Y-family DNA polymerase [Kaarinaea lacus]
MAKSTVVLPLRFASEQTQQLSFAPNGAEQQKHPLWLAIVFPQLFLELVTYNDIEQAVVVVEEYRGQRRILFTNEVAQHCGVVTGMSFSAAYALCPTLLAHAYDVAVEQDRLQQLAKWAQQFTSKLIIEPPRALLLEVRGSLRYFRGLKNLAAQIKAGLRQQWRHQHYFALSPTPIASLLLAQAGQSRVIENVQQLRSALGPLPVRLLPLNEKQLKQLYNLGVRWLRDLWRLPKDDLARRFGQELVNYLNRALGELPDPRHEFHWRKPFFSTRSWSFEVSDTQLLLAVARELVDELVTFLRQRDACITQCGFQFQHLKLAPTAVDIQVRSATRDADHIIMLLNEHINRLALAAPVVGLALRSGELQAFSAHSASLLMLPDAAPAPLHTSDVSPLLEQLQARLGKQTVKALFAKADHRPENAYALGDWIINDKPLVRQSMSTETISSTTMSSTSVLSPTSLKQSRPLWLFVQPQPLKNKNGVLWYQGPVNIISGPERIENGWWSSADVCRDYYVAKEDNGSRLWVFRDLDAAGQWYVHGLFA